MSSGVLQAHFGQRNYPAMNLYDLLLYLHDGAFSSFSNLLDYLPNSSLKCLRLVCKPIAAELFPRMFSRIYISAHETDLEIFCRIARHPVAPKYVREIVWDDTSFDANLLSVTAYHERLDDLKPGAKDVTALSPAHDFWSTECRKYWYNRDNLRDVDAIRTHVSKFRNLESITLMSRSRLTYVDPDAYWQVWQTPRYRKWKKQPYRHLLLDPEPFRFAIGTTVLGSEGVRPMQRICELVESKVLSIGALNVESIGGGQTSPSGGMTSNRYERKWHIDLKTLTKKASHTCPPPKIILTALLETQTQDLWRQDGIWESSLWQVMTASKHTLEELTFSSMCLDWFWLAIRLIITQQQDCALSACTSLHKLVFRNCWCSNPNEFLRWLSKSTGVKSVELIAVDMEDSSWPQLLTKMREVGTAFDHFELRRCRSSGATTGWQGNRAWDLPWNGLSSSVVPWLQGKTLGFPLTQNTP